MINENKLINRLQNLTNSYKTDKTLKVEEKLIEAASRGENELIIFSDEYDNHVIKWLEDEGLSITEGNNDHDRLRVRVVKFLKVSWG